MKRRFQMQVECDQANFTVALSKDARPTCVEDLIDTSSNGKSLKELFEDASRGKFFKSVLFIGKPGMGKTTSLILYTKYLVCKTKVKKDGGMHPCGKCSLCESAEDENSSLLGPYFLASTGNSGVESVRNSVASMPESNLFTEGGRVVFRYEDFHDASKNVWQTLHNCLEPVSKKVKNNHFFLFSAVDVNKIKADKQIFDRISKKITLDRIPIKEIHKRVLSILKSQKEYYPDNILELAKTEEGKKQLLIMIKEVSASSSSVRGILNNLQGMNLKLLEPTESFKSEEEENKKKYFNSDLFLSLVNFKRGDVNENDVIKIYNGLVDYMSSINFTSDIADQSFFVFTNILLDSYFGLSSSRSDDFAIKNILDQLKEDKNELKSTIDFLLDHQDYGLRHAILKFFIINKRGKNG
jgi:DNA polymerase III delta prime subunit